MGIVHPRAMPTAQVVRFLRIQCGFVLAVRQIRSYVLGRLESARKAGRGSPQVSVATPPLHQLMPLTSFLTHGTQRYRLQLRV
jgi:hypothetical protein